MALLRQTWEITPASEDAYIHEGLVEITGGALILWSPGRKEITAAYGAGAWLKAVRQADPA